MTEAVVLPGGMFGPASGMLMYVGEVPERRGATVHRHSWTAAPSNVFDASIEAWVRAQIAPVLDGLESEPLLIGKSLGTNAAVLAAERSLPAVWLTPVLTMPWVVEALDDATAPFLLIGGTGDGLWDGETARRLTPHVLEVEDADHGMFVPGPLADSITVLGSMIDAVEGFLDGIGWPA